MFRVIKGAHYWQPVVELSVKVGDVLFFEKKDTGVLLSKTNNPDASFIFFSENDFVKHFEDISERRDKTIDGLLNE